MKRNIAVLFIFAIIFVLIGEAQSARYGGPSASASKSSVSVAPASSKTISFSSSTTKAASTTITQPKGNNSLTNSYKERDAYCLTIVDKQKHMMYMYAGVPVEGVEYL